MNMSLVSSFPVHYYKMHHDWYRSQEQTHSNLYKLKAKIVKHYLYEMTKILQYKLPYDGTTPSAIHVKASSRLVGIV